MKIVIPVVFSIAAIVGIHKTQHNGIMLCFVL